MNAGLIMGGGGIPGGTKAEATRPIQTVTISGNAFQKMAHNFIFSLWIRAAISFKAIMGNLRSH